MNIKFKHLLAAVALITVFSEITLRMFGIQPGVYALKRFTPYQFDPEFGWVTRKNFSFFRAGPEFAHFNYYGPEGFPSDKKNKDLFLSKDIPKVAMIGDSFVESYYVPYESSFPYIIDQHSSLFQVMNLGVSGYSPGQYLMQARKHLPNQNLHSVFVFFHPFNDLRDLYRPTIPGGYSKPIFGQSLTNPLNTPLTNKKDAVAPSLDQYSSIVTILQPWLYSWFGYAHQLYNWYIEDKSILKYEYDHIYDALKYIRKIKQELNNDNLPFITVYIPSEFEYESDSILDNNFQVFLKACENLDLNCHIPNFFDVERSHYKNIFLMKDHHLSKGGSKKLAEDLIQTFF